MNTTEKNILVQSPSSKPYANSPIFITGAHRSGTTWTATMLSFASNTLQTEEPFNIRPHRYALNGMANEYFAYAPGMQENEAYEAFEKVVNSQTGRIFKRREPQRYLPFTRKSRLIIKDPIACMSSDWLSQNFDLSTIMLVRHPAAFAASLQRVGWDPDVSVFLNQEALMEDQLFDLREHLENPPINFVERCGLMWKVIYHVLKRYQEIHPEWIVCRHEDLAMRPQLAFQTLYSLLGLEWSDEVSRKIKEYTEDMSDAAISSKETHILKRNSRKSINSWKEILSVRDTHALKKITFPEWAHYYEEESWN